MARPPATYPPLPPPPQDQQAQPLWQKYFPRNNNAAAAVSNHHQQPNNSNPLPQSSHFNNDGYSSRFYPPPPPPPRPPPPPPPVSFIRPTTNSSYSDPPLLPPGTSAEEESPNDGTFAPLIHPPLPPLFPYLSPQLAQSLHEGSIQCGTSFVEETNDLPFIPVIINDKDLKKMTESVKTQFEETRQQNLLLYEDIIDPTWPKELRDMFQPLYCKLCKLTLSSPVVARDHYKGRRHVRTGEMWIQDNPHKVFKTPQQQKNIDPISGTIKPALGERYIISGSLNQQSSRQQHQQSFQGSNNNGPRVPFYQNQHGFDRSPAPPPPSYQNSSFKRNYGGERIDQNPPEFIPAYRAALSGGGPPGRKRQKKVKEGGPNFAYCGLCNVHHTSPITAEQHYSGKNHKAKLAANEFEETQTKPSNQPFADDLSCGNFSAANPQKLNGGDDS